MVLQGDTKIYIYIDIGLLYKFYTDINCINNLLILVWRMSNKQAVCHCHTLFQNIAKEANTQLCWSSVSPNGKLYDLTSVSLSCPLYLMKVFLVLTLFHKQQTSDSSNETAISLISPSVVDYRHQVTKIKVPLTDKNGPAFLNREGSLKLKCYQWEMIREVLLYNPFCSPEI